MKNKIIIFGSVLAAILLLMTPCISAVNTNTIVNKEKKLRSSINFEKINEIFDIRPLFLKEYINTLIGFVMFSTGLFIYPVAIITTVLLIIGSFFAFPIKLMIDKNTKVADFPSYLAFAFEVLKSPANCIKLGTYLMSNGEWPPADYLDN